MTDVLLVLILLVEAAGLCLRFVEPKGKKESEPEAPAAAAVPDGAAEKPTRQQKDFDEGFQNIMRYAVRGSTGFEDRE